MANNFNITDADINAALQIIDSHASTMKTTISHVENIGSDIGSSFRSAASTKFQEQLTNWGQVYGELLNAVQKLRDDLSQANSGITQTADDATSQASSLSSSISGVLAG